MNKFLDYINNNKFVFNDTVVGSQSHIAGREKDGKALIIARLTSDDIGSKIAVVYNMYTKETYICLPGVSTVKLPNGYTIEIYNDENTSVGGALYNPEGEGFPACSHRLSSYIFGHTLIDNENGVSIDKLGQVLEADTCYISEDYLK